MKKYLFFSLLVIISLLVLSGWSLAQETKTGEVRIYMPSPTDVSGSLPTATSPIFELEKQSVALLAEKCGVNTFSVEKECGIGAFKNLYFQCYDGYEEKQGGENSCKSSEVWQKYAEKVCFNRCGIIKEPIPIAEPLSVVEEVAPESKPISICYISDKLMRDYNVFLVELKEAETAGDKAEAERITEKIIDLKQQIEKTKEECRAGVQQPEAPIVIDRCEDVIHTKEKIDYYENLRNLSDAEVIEKTGFSREELGIENIIAEISERLEKVKEQCKIQGGMTVSEPVVTIDQIPVVVAEPVKPAAVESGQEIEVYFKAKIENITSVTDIDEQIENLKTLREEIDELIEKLIRSRKEIEAGELGNLITEIKVSQGEIKADDIVVKTTKKKILMRIGDKPISIEPTEEDVLIRDSGLEVKAREVSIKENVLRVGEANVGLAASYVAEKLKVSPKSVTLKEENEKAVYKMEVEEPRKLFGFIPLIIQKTLTTDANNGNLLKERRPWYAFLTTKP